MPFPKKYTAAEKAKMKKKAAKKPIVKKAAAVAMARKRGKK
jgi:hypothetical protein